MLLIRLLFTALLVAYDVILLKWGYDIVRSFPDRKPIVTGAIVMVIGGSILLSIFIWSRAL